MKKRKFDKKIAGAGFYRATAKMCTLSSGKTDKYEYLAGEKISPQ